jgi:hypothetical protein
MRRCLIVLIVLLATTVSAQWSYPALDAKNGFRDLTFGAPLPKEMKVTETSGKSTYYVRPKDSLTIGNATVKSIVYHFFDGRFAGVLIKTKGFVNTHALLQVFTEAYGTPLEANRLIPFYIWPGAVVTQSLDENMVSHDAEVSISSNALTEEWKADQKAGARKGAGDL